MSKNYPHKRTPQKNDLLAAALVPSGTLSRTLSNGILLVLVLLAGKMPALQEILGYFLNWKSLTVHTPLHLLKCGTGILPVNRLEACSTI